MMKKSMKALLACVVMLFTTNAFAGDFDWSQCWCNYGAGIKEGDVLVSVDGGINFGFFNLVGNNNWNIPAVIADVEVAHKIWKLPFTFGGYAGFNAWGHRDGNYAYSNSNFFSGVSATYHLMLPPEKLDVYGSVKTGFILHFYKAEGGAHNEGNPFNLDFATNIGASYYFTDKVGVNLEFGYPFSKFGLQLKF